MGYNPEETSSTPDYRPAFRPGDVLADLGPLGEADGLHVVRLRDGKVDMVWPEEVSKITAGGNFA